MGSGRIREGGGLEPDIPDGSLRGGQTIMYRPDLSAVQDHKATHALRVAFDYIEQLRATIPTPPEEIMPSPLPFPNPMESPPSITPEPQPSLCETPAITPGVAPTAMSFLFGGENAFAPGDGFLYTGNQVQGRIEIIEYFGLPTTVPAEIGQFDFPGGFLNMRVAVWGDTMYVTNNNKIEILDVVDRTNPSLLSPAADLTLPDYILAFNQSIQNVCLCKPILASISGATDQISTYSLSNPTTPSHLDTYPHPLDPPPGFGLFSGLNAGRRGVLFAASGGNLYSFDISNPSNIRLFDKIGMGANHVFRSFYQAFSYPGYIYSANPPSRNIKVYNVIDPNNMFLESSSVQCVQQPVSFSVDGSVLYVISDSPPGTVSLLEIYDIVDPLVPRFMASFQMPTLGAYSYGLLTRDGAFVGHDPTTGNPSMAWFTIRYPRCCNCNPFLSITGTN